MTESHFVEWTIQHREAQKDYQPDMACTYWLVYLSCFPEMEACREPISDAEILEIEQWAARKRLRSI